MKNTNRAENHLIQVDKRDSNRKRNGMHSRRRSKGKVYPKGRVFWGEGIGGNVRFRNGLAIRAVRLEKILKCSWWGWALQWMERGHLLYDVWSSFLVWGPQILGIGTPNGTQWDAMRWFPMQAELIVVINDSGDFRNHFCQLFTKCKKKPSSSELGELNQFAFLLVKSNQKLTISEWINSKRL